MGREGEATLNLIRPDGSGRRLVRRGEAGDPELSPDGRHILFMRHGDIVLMRTDGSHLRRLVDGPGGSDPIYFDASFTPSGSHVVFARYRRWYATELHAIRVDGTGRHLMTVLHGEYSSAGLSPDGRWIVAERSVDNAIGIWVTRRNGSRPRNLSRMGDDEFSWQPTFSPNGRWIAYSSWIHHVPQIFVMRRDGSGRRALTHYREGWNVWPVFSPDSRHIAFTREVGPDLHPRAVVIVMRADGTR
jgi:Tol biopolymer transport system component